MHKVFVCLGECLFRHPRAVRGGWGSVLQDAQDKCAGRRDGHKSCRVNHNSCRVGHNFCRVNHKFCRDTLHNSVDGHFCLQMRFWGVCIRCGTLAVSIAQ